MGNCRYHYLGVLTKVNLIVISPPLGWITVVRIYIRKRDGEMNEVKIEVVKTPVRELPLCRCPDLHLGPHQQILGWVKEKTHMIASMKCVPQLTINLVQMSILDLSESGTPEP